LDGERAPPLGNANAAAAAHVARPYGEHVGAHRLNLLPDIELGALADGDHDDNRGDTDNDAEHGKQ